MTEGAAHGDDRMRAGDADRERIVARLNEAFGEGRLDVSELDERVARAYAAKTLGDLRELTADLPAPSPTVPAPPPVRHEELPSREHGPGTEADRWARREARVRAARRGTVGAWASASAVNLVIWGLVVVTSGHWVYPWWIWVAGPWGALILASDVARRASR